MAGRVREPLQRPPRACRTRYTSRPWASTPERARAVLTGCRAQKRPNFNGLTESLFFNDFLLPLAYFDEI
jgi:hypothetical protein